MKSNKEKQFLDTIDDGIKTVLNFVNDDMVPHFIYCSGDGFYIYDSEKLILSRMKSCGLQSSILTQLCMRKQNLITKEKSKAAYEGKLKNEDHWNFWNCYDGSINDDMESFINNLQEISSLEEIKKEEVHSFFLPKLRKEELKLVEEKNFEHMMTYWRKFNADVDKEEMKKSDSKDKYVHGHSCRRTRILKLDKNVFKIPAEEK